MGATSLWFRQEWRLRRTSLVALLVLIAFATTFVATAVAGARRGASAVDRLLERTQPATVLVLLNQGAFDWDQVRSMPGVAAVSAFAVTGFAVEGLGEHPEVDPTEIGGFPFVDDQAMNTIEHPVVLRGRLADPTRADEVVVTQNFVDYFDKGVGDTVTLHLYAAAQLDSFDEGTPAGPTVDATIVGIVRSPWFSDHADMPAGAVQPSTGLYEQYPDNVVGTTGVVNVNAMVRLDDGSAGLDRFEQEFGQRFHVDNADFEDLAAQADHVRDVTSFESRALLLLALAAAIASVVFLGIAISRYCAALFADLDGLRSLGATPAQIRALVALPPVAAAVGGVLVSVIASFALSTRFPIGTAAPIEPSPGASFDWLILLVPVAAVPVLVVIACAMSLRNARDRTESAGPVSPVETMTSGWPVTVGMGTRFALAGRSTRSSPSARPALLASVLGVIGVVGALTFAHGVADATDGYERFGQNYELGVFVGAGGVDYIDPTAASSVLTADPDVDGVLDTSTEAARSPAGSLSLYSYGASGDPIDVVVTDGRLPRTAAEIALAPSSATSEDVAVGDTIDVSGTLGSRTLTVTGIAFVPAGPHNSYAEGGWVRPETFAELFDAFRFHFLLASTTPGVDPQVVVDRLASAGTDAFPGPILPVTERAELAELRTVPLLLAGFVTLLGVGAVGHALASTARRRRHDLAMLRALGMRPRDCGAIVFVQAAVIAVVALAIGIPLGLVVGRAVWRSVALDTPIEFVAPRNWPTIVTTALMVVGFAALLALRPSRRLASMPLAEELRSE